MNQELERTEELMKNAKKSSGKKTAIVVVVIAALVIAGTGGFFGMKAHKNSQAKAAIAQAEKYLEEGKYEDAIAAYDKVIEIDDKNAKAHEGKGDAYMGLNKPKEAIESYKSAIKNNPDKKDVYSKGTDAAAQAGDDGALKDFEKLITDNLGKEEGEAVKHGNDITRFLALLEDGDFDAAAVVNPEIQNADIQNNYYVEPCVAKMSKKQKTAYRAIVEQAENNNNEESHVVVGYMLADIDNDDNPELLLWNGRGIAAEIFIYSYKDDKANQIGTMDLHNGTLFAYPEHEGIMYFDWYDGFEDGVGRNMISICALSNEGKMEQSRYIEGVPDNIHPPIFKLDNHVDYSSGNKIDWAPLE